MLICFSSLWTEFVRNFLQQCVSEPTRNHNILDVIVTNNAEAILNITVDSTGVSDHDLVNCDISFSNLIPPNLAHRSSVNKHPLDELNFNVEIMMPSETIFRW